MFLIYFRLYCSILSGFDPRFQPWQNYIFTHWYHHVTWLQNLSKLQILITWQPGRSRFSNFQLHFANKIILYYVQNFILHKKWLKFSSTKNWKILSILNRNWPKIGKNFPKLGKSSEILGSIPPKWGKSGPRKPTPKP